MCLEDNVVNSFCRSGDVLSADLIVVDSHCLRPDFFGEVDCFFFFLGRERREVFLIFFFVMDFLIVRFEAFFRGMFFLNRSSTACCAKSS